MRAFSILLDKSGSARPFTTYTSSVASLPCLEITHSAVPIVFSIVPLATLRTIAALSRVMPLAWLLSMAVTLAPVSGRIFISNGFDPGCVKARLTVIVSRCSGIGYFCACLPIVFETLPCSQLAIVLDIVAAIALTYAPTELAEPDAWLCT